MKISIKNFGPIDHFEFDLEKDLHVIYGENNIGKSWAISLLYLSLKSWKALANLSIEQFNSIKEKQKYRLENTDKKFLLPETTWEEDEFIRDFNNSLYNTFTQMKNFISGLEPEIKFITNHFTLQITRDDDEEGDEELFFYNKGYVFSDLNVVEYLPNDEYENIYFLPASKSGIYQVLSNMGNIFAQLAQYSLRDKNLSLPAMNEPVSDYILNIATIQSKRQGRFNQLVDFLEEKVIEGSVIFDDFQKKLKYKSNRTGLVSELHEASSMIAEISPLVAYLKYILPKKNSILFIEEPEAHLHPKVQVEMMKIFVDLAKSGVKVVMTTHSDFMMNELSNLLLEKKIDADKVGNYHLVMGEKGSYDAGDMKATSEGIEDYNFTDVAVEQYERRMAILEKLNQDAIAEN
ncbi:AAA family ATPase [Emticicia sediminis]